MMKRSKPTLPNSSPEDTSHSPLSRLLHLLASFLLLAGLALAVAPTQAAVTTTWCEDNSADIDIPISECQALEDLYLSTAGENWTTKSGWLDSTTICDVWDGVSCDDGHVSSLTLIFNNLVGPMPASLGDLSALTALDLTDNELSGPIPVTLGSLETTLTSLLLGGNKLDGPIPLELGQLKELTTLDLGDNKLSGTIPIELGQLSKLTIWLFLGKNQLEGPIPLDVCNLSPLVRNIDFNKLDVSNLTPAKCDTTFPYWRDTQTVPPTNILAESVVMDTVQGSTAVTANVTISWLPIAYQEDGGYYEVLTQDKVSNHIASRGTTEGLGGKAAKNLEVIIPGDPTKFLYFVRTFTPGETSPNQSDLTSVDSKKVEIDTVAIRMLDIRANTPLLYLPALAPLALLLLTGIAIGVIFSKR